MRTALYTAGISERLNAELLKWAGAVLMLYEHFWRYALHQFPFHVYVVGRVVFPAFVIALAARMAYARQETIIATAKRMAVWSLIAAVGSYAARGQVPNVLMTFAAGTFLYAAYAGFARVRWAAVVATVVLSFGFEFGLAGVAAVFLALVSARAGSVPVAIGSAAAAGAALALAQTNHLIGAVGVLAACAVALVPIQVPRIKRLFYWVYVGQWPMIVAARALL